MRSLVIVFLGLLAGCGGITRACTLIGCSSGLMVPLGMAPAGGYRVEAFVPGQQGSFVYDCAGGTECRAFFTDFTPDQVTVRVTSAAGTREQPFTPAYNVSRPNGPGCGPECRNASISFFPAP